MSQGNKPLFPSPHKHTHPPRQHTEVQRHQHTWKACAQMHEEDSHTRECTNTFLFCFFFKPVAWSITICRRDRLIIALYRDSLFTLKHMQPHSFDLLIYNLTMQVWNCVYGFLYCTLFTLSLYHIHVSSGHTEQVTKGIQWIAEEHAKSRHWSIVAGEEGSYLKITPFGQYWLKECENRRHLCQDSRAHIDQPRQRGTVQWGK